jgi:hypothetical protein
MEGEMKKTAITFIIFALGIFLFSGSQCAFASSITQGEYAIQLAKKLGMGQNLSADAAIAALTKVEIMPAHGFKPGNPMNPVIAAEILNAARKACKKGLLSSLPCFKQSHPLPGKCCEEVFDMIESLNEDLHLLPPAPPTLPPPPLRDPASVSS